MNNSQTHSVLGFGVTVAAPYLVVSGYLSSALCPQGAHSDILSLLLAAAIFIIPPDWGWTRRIVCTHVSLATMITLFQLLGKM
jgi:hypothetical protein